MSHNATGCSFVRCRSLLTKPTSPGASSTSSLRCEFIIRFLSHNSALSTRDTVTCKLQGCSWKFTVAYRSKWYFVEIYDSMLNWDCGPLLHPSGLFIVKERQEKTGTRACDLWALRMYQACEKTKKCFASLGVNVQKHDKYDCTSVRLLSSWERANPRVPWYTPVSGVCDE